MSADGNAMTSRRSKSLASLKPFVIAMNYVQITCSTKNVCRDPGDVGSADTFVYARSVCDPIWSCDRYTVRHQAVMEQEHSVIHPSDTPHRHKCARPSNKHANYARKRKHGRYRRCRRPRNNTPFCHASPTFCLLTAISRHRMLIVNANIRQTITSSACP